MARKSFEVKRLEFKIIKDDERFCEEAFKGWLQYKFYEFAKRYIPKIISRVKSSYFYRNKLIIEFKRTISLNTLNNILYSLPYTEDIEYNVKEEKVIVKVR